MKPVFQTQFGKPLGNCFTACLASLLELPLAQFPFPPYEDDWMGQVNRHLETLGWTYVDLPADSAYAGNGRFLCVVSGTSPRGLKHSVIARHRVGEDNFHWYDWVHDPNPEGGWVAPIENVGFLVPLEPRL